MYGGGDQKRSECGADFSDCNPRGVQPERDLKPLLMDKKEQRKKAKKEKIKGKERKTETLINLHCTFFSGGKEGTYFFGGAALVSKMSV